MEQKDIAVSTKHLSKIYKIFDSPGQRLKSLLFKTNAGRDFQALDDINLEIKKGEAFAIIGKNGSGKSTMLQLLAGIIKPTSGEVVVNGRIAALLELGSGFDPESTGYENIYMNAATLGLSKEEIEAKIQEIIEFADIGEHLYQPVKTYSSGMYVRLGFAVAINVDADILLVDEALAVGDVFFRQKCYTRLNELKKKGVTIILVTHNMSEVEQFCDRALFLRHGKTINVGRSQEIVKEYYLDNSSCAIIEDSSSLKQEELVGEYNTDFKSKWEIKENNFFDLANSNEISNGRATFEKIGLFNKNGEAQRVFEQGEWGYFYAEIDIKEDVLIPILGIVLYNEKNTIVHGKDTTQTYLKLPLGVRRNSKVCFLQKVKFDIAVGEYSFEVTYSEIMKETYLERENITQEFINAGVNILCMRNNVGVFSIVNKKRGTPTRMGFHGNCDLPGETEIIVKGRENNDSKKSK